MASSKQIEELRQRFLSEWTSGNTLRLEQFLLHEELACDDIFQPLLCVELKFRRERGERDEQLLAEYCRRFPDRREQILHEFAMAWHEGDQSTVAFGFEDTPKTVVEVPPHLELIEEIGTGGFGSVYRANDRRLSRIVAVKLPRVGREHGRFLKEASLAAQLSHPGIVPVFEVGETPLGPYIVSEYVSGPTLALALSTKTFSFRETARLLSDVAIALHYAHRKGIVHRDLKPSNLIIDEAAEELERIRILDFGLARDIRMPRGSTLTGKIIGTPAYMSPEQARGQAADERADIYSLGVILHRMLWGHFPHTGPPVGLKKSKLPVPSDLNAICTKCLAENPAQRYQTAGELSGDLLNWLEVRPVSAKPSGQLERFGKWCRRHPQLAAMTATLVFIIVLGLFVHTRQSRKLHESSHQGISARIDGVLIANDDQLPLAMERLQDVYWDAEQEILGRMVTGDLTHRDRLRLRIAMLPSGAGDGWHRWDELARSAGPAEIKQLISYAKQIGPDQRAELVEYLWAELNSGSIDERGWGRLGVALAALDSANPDWDTHAARLVAFVLNNSSGVDGWSAFLMPVSDHVHKPLIEEFNNEGDKVRSLRACRILTGIYAGSPSTLVDLLKQGRTEHLTVLIPALTANDGNTTRELLNQVLALPAPPIEDNEEHEATMQTRANAAVALLAVSGEATVWPYLRHFPDPRMQTYLIHQAAECGVPARVFADRLLDETDAGAVYSLLLVLGTYPADPAVRAPVTPKALDLYRSHPDAGVHAAADWLLRAWGRADEITKLDTLLISDGIIKDRDWYLTKQGICMTIVRGPTVFTMGSPSNEANRHSYEVVHNQHLSHSFAISDREFTFADLQSMGIELSRDRFLSPTLHCPVSTVNWDSVAEICSSLSRVEGLDSEKQPMTKTDDGTWHIDIRETGYRLPTSAEWEFACRGGTSSSRFFGTHFTPFAQEYSWYTPEERLAEVGLHMPNQLGLFDCFGNVNEWVIGRHHLRGHRTLVHTENGLMQIESTDLVAHRGGCYLHREVFFRSAWWTPSQARREYASIGFRVARTLDWPSIAP